MVAVRCNPIPGSVGRIPDAEVSNLRAIWSSVEAADQRVLKVIGALSVMVGDIGRMREDNARMRGENARLQAQIGNISLDEGDGSPEARMSEHARFVETMIELRRFEYDMRLAAEQRLDRIAEEMKSAKEEIASLRAQRRDAENDAKDLEARRLNDAEGQVFPDGSPGWRILLAGCNMDVAFPMEAGNQEAEVVQGAGPIFGRPCGSGNTGAGYGAEG
jgi:regulator of replication initiation timing